MCSIIARLALLWASACLVGCLSSVRTPFCSVQFEGSSGLIVGGESHLTTDGGLTWRRIPVSVKTDPEFDCTRAKSSIALVGGEVVSIWGGGSLRSTADWGDSWTTLVELPKLRGAKYFKRLAWLGLGAGFIEAHEEIWFTNDSGANWVRYDGRFELRAAFALNGGREWVYQLGNSLFSSTDGGDNWQPRSWGGGANILPFKQYGPELRSLTYSGEVVLLDTRTWATKRKVPVGEPPENPVDYSFAENHVVAITPRSLHIGLILDSTVRWTQQDFPEREGLRAVGHATGGTFVVGGQYGTIPTLSSAFAYQSSDLREWVRMKFSGAQ